MVREYGPTLRIAPTPPGPSDEVLLKCQAPVQVQSLARVFRNLNVNFKLVRPGEARSVRRPSPSRPGHFRRCHGGAWRAPLAESP